jgi:aspartate aminotransferase
MYISSYVMYPNAAFSDAVMRLRSSPILKAATRARAARAAGRDVLDLTLGEPDFPTPMPIIEAAFQAARNGATRYTPTGGTLELRQAICQKFLRDNALHFEPDQITVSGGAKQVIYQAFVATLNPGDEVILPAPYWASYADMVELLGGRAVIVSTRIEDGFRLQPEALRQAIGARTRWLVLNAPSNPSGAVYSASELRKLADVLVEAAYVRVLSDDIYEHILFDGNRFETLAAVVPDFSERILTVNGMSKAYSMTGWRVGYAAGSTALIAAINKVQMQVNSHACSISQAAAIAALNGPAHGLQERRIAFEQRRDLVSKRLASIPGVRCAQPDGAFYAFVSFEGWLGQSGGSMILNNDEAICAFLLEHGVAVIPGSAFGAPGFARLSFATDVTTLNAALERIAAAAQQLFTSHRA